MIRRFRNLPFALCLGIFAMHNPSTSLAQEQPPGGIVEGSVAPLYFIRYLADVYDSDGDLVEEGIFNTVGQANEIINMLAHFVIAAHIDCQCEEFRRDIEGVFDVQMNMYELLPSYGYIPRFIPASEVATLSNEMPVRSPYVINPSTTGPVWNCGQQGQFPWSQCQISTTTVFDSSNPNLYARGGLETILIDSRLESLVQARAAQITGGAALTDQEALCQFAENNHDANAMIGWVITRDLMKNWP